MNDLTVEVNRQKQGTYFRSYCKNFGKIDHALSRVVAQWMERTEQNLSAFWKVEVQFLLA